MSTLPPPIRRPGVDVVQSIRNEPAVISLPVLMPTIVGPCYKMLEATNIDGTLNEDSRLDLPAVYQPLFHDTVSGLYGVGAGPYTPGGLNEKLFVSVNGAPEVEIDFSPTVATAMTLAAIIAYIQTKLDLAGCPAKAELLETSSTTWMPRIRTTAKGSSAALACRWTGATDVIRRSLHLPKRWDAQGYGSYNNDRLLITQNLLPDPWNLQPDLDLIEDELRAFLTTSSIIQKEMSKTECITRCGSSKMKMVDDGDGDSTSPIFQLDMEGVPNPTLPLDYTGYQVDPLVPVTDPLLVDFASAAAAARYDGTGVVWPVILGAGIKGHFEVAIDGWQKQVLEVIDPDGIIGVVEADVLAAINERFSTFAGAVETALAVNNAGQVRINGMVLGREGKVVVGGADAHQLITFGVGITAADFPRMDRGTWHPVVVGDEIWVDGVKLGMITQIINPGGVGADIQVRLDVEYALTKFDPALPAPPKATLHNWYVISKTLPAELEGNGTRPLPELFIDTHFIQLRHDVLRGTKGEPLTNPVAPTNSTAFGGLFAKFLRLDVSAAATIRDAEPVQISANDFTGLETQFAPIDQQNPVGLGAYFALLNSGDVPVLLMGVDEVSDDYPEGTPDSYARAYKILESLRAYVIAPLSQELEVAQNLHAHVRYMSATKRRMERVGFVTTVIPDRDEPTLIGSATTGNAGTTGTPRPFQTGLSNLGDLFLAAGLTGAGPWTEADGIYIDIEGDAKHYLVQSYAGSTIFCIVGSTGNGFFSETMWTVAIVDKSFSIQKRGALLVDTAGNPDRTAMAIAMGKKAAYFQDRRMVMGAPGECQAVVGGLDVVLPSYYLACGTAASRCSTLPSTPLTNAQVIGFTKVIRSNGYFREEDMDQAAGYGLWWWVNDEITSVVVNRHQLTTDPTSVKTRELSYTAAVDYGSYMLRDGLRSMIGSMTINTQSVELLAMTVTGILDFLVGTRVWLSYEDFEVRQGPFEATPEDLAEGLGPGGEDEVLVQMIVKLPPPLNRVRIRVVL
jgi:hypothetical protein